MLRRWRGGSRAIGFGQSSIGGGGGWYRFLNLAEFHLELGACMVGFGQIMRLEGSSWVSVDSL